MKLDKEKATPVIFKVKGWHMGPLSDDGVEFSEPTQWCHDNVGMRHYQWDRLVHSGAYNRLVVYYFRDPDEALMFKMTFGDLNGVQVQD